MSFLPRKGREIANIKRQCPLCGERDQEFHSEETGGTTIREQDGMLTCLRCGHIATKESEWIVEQEEEE